MLQVYNQSNLPLFFYIDDNANIEKNIENNYYFGYTSTVSANLTFEYCVDSTCSDKVMKYTDPDGEWVHLVIGAIFGGFTNWAMNGAQFSWKGLGYFGVGAVAGALGAGVGAGIQTASAGASFWAGFVGTQQGISTILSVGYSSSFINGFTSGFGAGFASGFTSGFGNSLMQGQSFGQSLKEGGINGLVGGVSSGLIGGIGGGIDAKRDGRYFFTGRYDKFEQTIDGHKYYFYSDKKVIAEEAHRLSEGREVATYRVKESFLKKYSVILDPTGNTATESANYTLSYNGKSYLSSSRYRMLSQTHYDYSPLGEIGIGGIGDALFANKYNIPVTHVSYYNNFYTEFIPNQWTHSNYRNFINHNYVNLLDCFDKIFENVLRLW